jgi:hypothetical protein
LANPGGDARIETNFHLQIVQVAIELEIEHNAGGSDDGNRDRQTGNRNRLFGARAQRGNAKVETVRASCVIDRDKGFAK